jgi:hypothetical protein
MPVRLVLIALAVLLAPVLRAEERDPLLQSRAFVFKHVDVKEANAIVRSLLDLRKTAIDLELNQMLALDEESKLDEAERVVAMIDVPRPVWRAQLVAVLEEGTEAVRTLDLAGKASWESGQSAIGDILAISLESQPRAYELTLDVTTSVRAGGDTGAQVVRRNESQRIVVRDGDEVELVRTADASAQESLQRLTGASSPVRALRLEIDGGTPPVRSKRR